MKRQRQIVKNHAQKKALAQAPAEDEAEADTTLLDQETPLLHNNLLNKLKEQNILRMQEKMRKGSKAPRVLKERGAKENLTKEVKARASAAFSSRQAAAPELSS